MPAKNSHLKGYIDMIERVQRRATRTPFGFEKLVYEERIKSFSLTMLKDRRVRGDLFDLFKVMSSRESINWIKPLNKRKNVEISRLAASLRRDSLNMRRVFKFKNEEQFLGNYKGQFLHEKSGSNLEFEFGKTILNFRILYTFDFHCI